MTTSKRAAVRQPSVEYRIEWVWKYDTDRTVFYDHYRATTVPRAISKFMAAMGAEYANAEDILVLAAMPSGRD